MTQKRDESYFPEVNHDRIDYTGALLREDGRRLRAQELVRTRTHMLNNTVRTGFIQDDEYEDFPNTDDIWFDVLPSFEMHRSLHQSTAGRADETEPPVYTHEDSLPPTPSETTARMRGVSLSPVDTPSVSFQSHRSSIVTGSSDNTSHAPGSASNLQDYDSLNTGDPTNTHRLPKMPCDSSLAINIYVTKSHPKIGEKQELESMLKEYTSGDLIHGYVIVNNNTSKRIPFHMFYVTLEGSVSIVDPQEKKMYSRKFLHMIDLNASWSYGCISPSSNLHYKWGDIDYDGCALGLPPCRLLEPNTKYKKFFTFKVPYNLLDNTCKHGQELHTLLPPSLGVNRYAKDGKYAHIDLNEALGYGHLGKRGSPILTKDMSNGTASINYSINTTLIGLHPTRKDSMGQPLLAVMKDEDYALRFIPFGFGVSLFSPESSLRTLKGTVQSSLKNAERKLMLSIEGNEEEVRKLDHDIKVAQLSGISTMYREKDVASFPLRNVKHATPDYSKLETTVNYVPAPKKSLFGTKKTPISNSSGVISITTHLPKDGLPYISPSLIRKTNEVSNLNTLGLANYDMMNNALSPNEKRKLTHLEFDLNFLPSDLAMMNLTTPPEFSEIRSKLLVINVFSKSSIPVKISSDLFAGGCDKVCLYSVKFKQLKSEFKKFSEELDQLKKKFEDRGLDLEDFRKYVDRSIEEDVNAMKELDFESSIHPVFKKPELVVEKSTPWNLSEDGKSWKRHVQMDLEFHENIRETLIPNFQTCLLSRIYCIQTEFKFEGCDSISIVRIPIRLRWFD